MSGQNCELDIRQDSVYDMKVNRNRTLDQTFDAYFVSGDTEYEFDFGANGYTGATMQVRKQFGSTFTALTFSTSDGSITLGANGQFNLNKSATDLQKVRAGDYIYDMYLSSASVPKRAFLSGEFKLFNYVTP
jgi:hypothetical protein